jgi:hypothetical protein
MNWLFVLAFVGLIFWLGRRARDNAAERAASGMSADPLYRLASVLVLVLLGLVATIMVIHRQGHVPGFLFALAGGIAVALLWLRRSLKWRYPY